MPKTSENRARGLLVDTYRLALCAAVGAATGVIAIGFRSAVGVIEHGLAAVADGLRDAQESALAGVLVVAGPAVGGLVVGLLVYRLIRLRGGHGVPAVITAAAADRPMSDWRMGVKASSSIITIGSGGSVGPEGPIVELGAVFGSYAWKVFRLPGQWVRIMMGCGAAAGIAAIFNVPLGGVIFVLDVVLRDYSLRSLVPLMVASMSASIVTRYAGTPAVQLPAYTLGGDEMLCAPIIGLLAGLVSTLFIRANFFAADMFKRLPAPIWLRPAVGGLCVGLIGLGMARVHGEGYTAIEQMVVNAAGTNPAALVVLALLAFCLAKILATAATLGSGGTGGAFAPSLVIGTALGLASAGMWPRLVPGAELNPAACALIGMAGLLGGVFQAPLSGVVIAFNLSRWNAQLLLPLMCVAVISAWLSQHLARASIYDLSLLREGVDLAASRSLQNILAGRGIDDLIRTPVISVHEEATLGQMIDALSQSTQVVFPVVDARD
ncbi:MAG TPA: chloride channel protein, partial [Phycisphaerae bacterium]